MGYCHYNKPSDILTRELNSQKQNFNSGPMLQSKEEYVKMKKIEDEYNEAIKILKFKNL